MTSKFVVPQYRSYGFTLGTMLVLPIILLPVLPLQGATGLQLATAALFVLVGLALASIALYGNFRVVEVDPIRRNIVVGNRLRPSGLLTYPFRQFTSVRSINTRGNHPKTRVELVSVDGLAPPIAGRFDAGVTRAKSFFSLPRYCENEQATALRTRLATVIGLEDHGYLGILTFNGEVPRRTNGHRPS